MAKTKFYAVANVILAIFFAVASTAEAQVVKAPFLPSQQELNRPFGQYDELSFLSPPKVYYPETWFHFIGGNVSKEGITADLEAIAKAGFSGIHLFHGQFGGPWPGVQPQITCLSPSWDDAVKHAAATCERLGLKFLMNNTPGWATSGGPWIKPSNAMRTLIWSRIQISDGIVITQVPLPQPSSEPWRDYKDIAVLAYPTPAGDTADPLIPRSIKGDTSVDWLSHFTGQSKDAIHLPASTPGRPHWIDITLTDSTPLRTVEFPRVTSLNYVWCYDPGIKIVIQAILPDGKMKDIASVEMPAANFEDDQPVTLACSEAPGASKYRISIFNQHDMDLSTLRLLTAARKNNWEAEAAWTLRSLMRTGDNPQQLPAAFIDPTTILDISDKMDKDGNLTWKAPKGDWTIVRFGHVNKGQKNGPAPAEGTGWEANKLAKSGADAQFAGYIGRLSGKNGPLSGGLLDGMLIDSWECHTQSWTEDMESEFNRVDNYSLRMWLPALMGYVIKDPETTTRFLTDWRRTLNDLFANNFYGRMATLTHANGLKFTFETAAGDVLPGDILEYFKFADVPMCEFWQPMSDNYVGSLNFKPIRPTVSAARIYGKPRVAAESFTSFDLTWDEHFAMLREVANFNAEQGVTHFVFHTYTHNPQKPFVAPGSSFGAGIGTPFLRGQTWWPYMPDFNGYLARCTYLLERGKPVSDVLWYLGDEIDHKPDQNADFPVGFKYDYCNPDVLINRLTVQDGLLTTPEGIRYRVLWLPNAKRMLPATLEKLYSLVRDGAAIVGEAPSGLATLSGGNAAQSSFDDLVKKIWGNGSENIRRVGRGYVFSGMTIGNALTTLKVEPDVIGGDALWLHRRTEGADWYFISAPKGKGFSGELSFRTDGPVELWDPVTGISEPVACQRTGHRTIVKLDLAQSNACFVVFRHTKAATSSSQNKKLVASIPISGPWTITFPSGWGISAVQEIKELKPWKELDVSPEGKAFSGTATYKTTFTVNGKTGRNHYVLDLGDVDMAAAVIVNGKKVGDLLAPPYRIDLKDAIQTGQNTLEVKVTSTWFNRLVFDAGQPEEKRKTWVINGPDAKAPLRASGLMGPVAIQEFIPSLH
jgi:alpha-L-rhamnosidase